MEDGAESGWVAFGTVEDIPAGGARAVRTLIGEIGLFRTGDGRVFALDNICPHKGARLSEGCIEGDHVVCPLHGWKFALADGSLAIEVEHEGSGARSLPVRVADSRVLVRLFGSRS